jgi:hypothetical protein
MRTLILTVVAAVLLAGSALAQNTTFTEPKRNGQDVHRFYVPPTDVTEAFGSRLNWEINRTAFFADVHASGYVDTSYGDTAIYYGHIIATGQIDYWPRVHITGMDSVTIQPQFRAVSHTGNTFAYGPWNNYGGTVTLTTRRSFTAGLGGGRDTLVLFDDPGIAGTNGTFADDTTFAKTKPPYGQFRYIAVSDRALDASKAGGQTHFVKPTGRNNYGWLGEAVLLLQRKWR